VAQLELDIAVRLRQLDHEVELTAGDETLALVGPSGAGKTTVLRCVAGLHTPDRGRIALDGEPWFDAAAGVDVPPERRRVGLVFQDYALFPHMTVRENVAFGGRERVDELLRRLRIEHVADVKPRTISGGERQRTALARALARGPRALLLDEPLAALDAHTRAAVRDELHALLASLGLPAILVTHDFRDAAALADRVGVLVEGRLRQVGTPAELVAAPADAFVAAFTGANVVERPDGPHAIHPWEVELRTEPGDDGAVEGTITSLMAEGDRVRLRVGALAVERPAAEIERLGLKAGDRAWAVLPRARLRRIGPARG
jgi:ABC-type sulfate/molybdate transport systems ATPase subunit